MKKTWISIVIAAVIIIGLMAFAVVGGTAFFIYRHVHSQFSAVENAEQEFTSARARFAGQQPLIEMRLNDEPVLHRELVRGGSASARPLELLRVLAYDGHAHKLVSVSIPFWLMRLVPSKNLSFLNDESIDLDSERVHLTIEDLDRRGPGLVLDQKDKRGSHVLVWTE
jgi:hypothetical protein